MTIDIVGRADGHTNITTTTVYYGADDYDDYDDDADDYYSDDYDDEEEEGEEEESDSGASESGLDGAYYGGYGRCYNCGESTRYSYTLDSVSLLLCLIAGARGHWANGCPY